MYFLNIRSDTAINNFRIDEPSRPKKVLPTTTHIVAIETCSWPPLHTTPRRVLRLDDERMQQHRREARWRHRNRHDVPGHVGEKEKKRDNKRAYMKRSRNEMKSGNLNRKGDLKNVVTIISKLTIYRSTLRNISYN